MKRTNTSGRALSSVALAMMTRLVCLSKSGASDDFMISRVLPASSSATPNGPPPHPTVDLSAHGRGGVAGGHRLEVDLVVPLQRQHAGVRRGAIVGIGDGLAREVLRAADRRGRPHLTQDPGNARL